MSAPVPTLHSYAQYLASIRQAFGLPAVPQADDAAAAAGSPSERAFTGCAGAADPAPWQSRRYAVGQRFQHGPHLPEMLVLPAGAFCMGAHPLDPDAVSDERPRHAVRLHRPFAIGCTPVTFDQWDACLAAGGTRHRPPDASWGRGARPVIHVNWFDAEEYVAWLSRETGERYRLLTEAEWEYACWGGAPQHGRFPWGDDYGLRQLHQHAWSAGNSGYRSHPVAQKTANGFGLHDMLGNVWEWVADHYARHGGDRPDGAVAHRSASRSASCVIRGGSWLDAPEHIRPSARRSHQPMHRAYHLGLRVAMDLPPASGSA